MTRKIEGKTFLQRKIGAIKIKYSSSSDDWDSDSDEDSSEDSDIDDGSSSESSNEETSKTYLIKVLYQVFSEKE